MPVPESEQSANSSRLTELPLQTREMPNRERTRYRFKETE